MNDDIADRVLDAGAGVASLRQEVEAGAPWPASAHFGVEPEASWNPPELLAHLAEMLPYWMGQIEQILDGSAEPVPFGRVQADEQRIAAIGRDRALPVGRLFDMVADRTTAAAARLRSMSAADLARRGLHPTLGEMTVEGVIERMYLNHLAEHEKQLRSILAGTARSS